MGLTVDDDLGVILPADDTDDLPDFRLKFHRRQNHLRILDALPQPFSQIQPPGRNPLLPMNQQTHY